MPPMDVESSTGLVQATRSAARYCHALLAGWDVQTTLRFANAAGAVVAGRLACADAVMPATAEARRGPREGPRA